jgi:hypothetical protein
MRAGMVASRLMRRREPRIPALTDYTKRCDGVIGTEIDRRVSILFKTCFGLFSSNTLVAVRDRCV